MNITKRFELMKKDDLNISHFNSADVINNEANNHIVLYSDGTSIDVIFYKSSDDYVNQVGTLLCRRSSYSESLQLAHLILKGQIIE